MQEIKNNSVILAPSVLHPVIQQELLKTKTGIIGIRLSTIEGYFLSFVTHPDTFDDILYRYREKLQTLQPSLRIYQNICLQEYFLKECVQMIDELKIHEVSPVHLPQTTQEEKELFEILNALFMIPTKMDYVKKAFTQIKSTQTVYIYPALFHEREQILVDYLLQHGAILLTNDNHESPRTSFYHAMNSREEIEGIAQYIIEQDLCVEEINITLCNEQYKPLITQIFHRYNLPHTILSKRSQHLPAQRFSKLLSFYLQPNKENFMPLLDYEIFAIENQKEWKEYMQLFERDWNASYPDLPSMESELITPYEMAKLQQLCEQAKHAQTIGLELLTPLLHLDWEEALIQIDTLVASNLPMQQKNNEKKLQSYLQHVFPYLHAKEDLFFLCESLRKQTTSITTSEMQGILIHDLKTLLPVRSYHFIVGATQSDYPAFSLKKGIFDETYHAKLKIPTMQKRYDTYIQQLQQQFLADTHLIVTYPLGNYEGKGNEAALEIETVIQKKAKPMEVQYQQKSFDPLMPLSSQQSSSLYMKDDVLHGSISSLERYIKCPFSYYLRYGLRLREPFQATFDESKIGTLAHHILERLTKEYGKQYAQVDRNAIEAMLSDELTPMMELYPNRFEWLELLKQRMLVNIQQKLKVLKDMEEHSEMSILKSEYEFYYEYPLHQGKLKLHGFIDRMDHKNEYLRIIDYKSSMKSLQEHDVFSALQLQLITYGIVASKEFHKKLLGTHYVSLKNENIPYTAGKMKRRPVEYIPLTDQDYEGTFYQTHRMQGWNMDEHLEILDDNGSHIIGVTMNASGEVKARKIYDIEILEKLFDEMYKKIGNQILSGNITLQPEEHACQYCKYHEICRFKGFASKKDPLVEYDEHIYR